MRISEKAKILAGAILLVLGAWAGVHLARKADETVHPTLNETEVAERKARSQAIEFSKRVIEARRSCKVPDAPNPRTLKENFELKAEGKWPRYTEAQAKCLNGLGIPNVKAGAYVE